jgi:hypothetical protein
MLATFQYNVSRKAHDVDGIFARFKSQLANLAFTAGTLLSKPATVSPPVFNMKYYKQTSTAPLDYVYSPAYDRKISLNFTDATINYLAELEYDPNFGARPVKRVIQREVLNVISRKIIANQLNPKDKITVDTDGKQLIFLN